MISKGSNVASSLSPCVMQGTTDGVATLEVGVVIPDDKGGDGGGRMGVSMA